MARSTALCVLSLSALSACGDLSQEDLLFLAAVPPKESLEMRPAGVASSIGRTEGGQALERECERNDYRCEAENIATDLNKLTFDLLDIIDAVQRFPPSHREPGRRVWGPHYVAKDRSTFRFEMVRSKDGNTFAFCLHAKQGVVRWGSADTMDCSDDQHEESGLTLFLEGQFTPGEVKGAQARSGVGEMTLHTKRIPEAKKFADALVFTFDNSEGTQIDVDLKNVPIDNEEGRRDALYSFRRDPDNSGTFLFEVFVDVLQPLGNLGPERITSRAGWLADQSGRADVSITEGDAPDGAVASQCWAADQQTVYHSPFGEPVVGTPDLCSITEPLAD